VGVPIIGKISWFSDHGKGSNIASASELETFYYMQNQAAKMPGKPEEKPKPTPPQQIVVIQDNRIQDNRSYHQHETMLLAEDR